MRNAQAWAVLLVVLLTSCRGPDTAKLPVPVTVAPEPPVFVTAPAEEALPQLVAAERAMSIRGDLAGLAQLWAPEAQLVDGRGTLEPEDDYRWRGRESILDRYRLAVFPSPPPPLPAGAFDAAAMTVEGDTATLQRAGDHWRFVRRAGRWWLLELRY